MNTTLGPRLGHRPTLYPVSEDTRTITTWTQLQLTCTQPPVAPLTTTMGLDNDCCQPGLMAALWEWKQAGKAAQSCQLRVSTSYGLRSGAETLLDKSCRIYLKEMHLYGKHGHMLWTLKGVLIWTLDPNGKNSTSRHLLPERCRHWASRKWRQEKPLLNTDSTFAHRLELNSSFFCVGCTFWFALFLLLLKKPYVI